MDLQVNGVTHGLFEGLHVMKHFGVEESTRNGRVLTIPSPIGITNLNPRDKVIDYPGRNENPYFHFMEALWMLTGFDDVDFVAQFNPRMREYSDGGTVFHGAYGFRWREHFGFNQIGRVIWQLKEDITTRRAVLTMWDPEADLGVSSVDLPCNTHIYFRYIAGKLDMTVCNRSNDLVWGLFGANAVHMGYLHEYVAACVGVEMGYLHTFTNNLHLYLDTGPGQRLLNELPTGISTEEWSPTIYVPLVGENEQPYWSSSVSAFIRGQDWPHDADIVTYVAKPMMLSWQAHKRGQKVKALAFASMIGDAYWALACTLYLERMNARS